MVTAIRLIPVADGVHRAVWLDSARGLGDALVVEDGVAGPAWRAVADIVVADGAVDAAVRSYVDELDPGAAGRAARRES